MADIFVTVGPAPTGPLLFELKFWPTTTDGEEINVLGEVSLTIPLASVVLEHLFSLQDLLSKGRSMSAQKEDVFVQFPDRQLTTLFCEPPPQISEHYNY